MRISDWSLDVCSSDLLHVALGDASAVDVEQAGDGPQERCLAGTVGSQQSDDLPRGDSEAHASQNQHAVVVDDLEVGDAQCGSWCPMFSDDVQPDVPLCRPSQNAPDRKSVGSGKR